jgi:hypothetical protein
MMKQRDMMRRLAKQFDRDKATVCRAYAAAERDGQVGRVQNSKNLSAEEYADALWRDGERKGWF